MRSNTLVFHVCHIVHLTPWPDFNDRVFTVLSFLAVWSWNLNVKIKVHLMPLDISPILGSKDVLLILVHVFMILESQCQNKSTFNVGRQLSCAYFGFQGCPLNNGMCLWSWNINLKITLKVHLMQVDPSSYLEFQGCLLDTGMCFFFLTHV